MPSFRTSGYITAMEKKDKVSPTSKPRSRVGRLIECPLMSESRMVMAPMRMPTSNKITIVMYFAKTRLPLLTGKVISYLLHLEISSARREAPMFTTNRKICTAMMNGVAAGLINREETARKADKASARRMLLSIE